MEFVFLDAADKRLFVRSDAEQATWTTEELSLHILFPYQADKAVTRGMRIAFQYLGAWQVFEVRKVINYEPDHYQDITAEHIVISELSDEHCNEQDITDKTIAQTLPGILSGSLWGIGTNTAANVSSVSLSRGSVWQAVRQLEQNWNCYITPRIAMSATGITGRYLDVAPAVGVWRGVHLSVDKNAADMGVTIDDTELITAIYAYGGNDEDGNVITLEKASWARTTDHPAKPAGQMYLLDPDANAVYGRNGRPRYGFYQNTEIKDPQILLEKAWEALKKDSAPKITIDCVVSDLYRLGYADQPLRLHDTAMVEIRPTGNVYQLEIIQLQIDLLDPTVTRPTIGAYIPNIVYISKAIETETVSRGGGGGGRGSSNAEKQKEEFETQIVANKHEIELKAYQRDVDNLDSILYQAGMYLDADQVLVYSTDNPKNIGYKFQEITGSALWANRENVVAATGKMTVDARGNLVINEGAGLYVTRNGTQLGVWDSGNLTAGIIVDKINGGRSSTIIKSDMIELDGEVVAKSFSTLPITCESITVNNGGITVSDGSIITNYVACDTYEIDGDICELQEFTVNGITYGQFLGPAAINFNIADTQWFKTYVSALTLAWTDGTYGPSYDDESHEYIVPIEIVDQDNKVLNNDIWFSGTEAYEDGKVDANSAVTLSKAWTGSQLTVRNSANSNTVSTVLTLSEGAWAYNSETGQYEKSVAARADSSDRVSSTVSGKVPYDKGVEVGESHFSLTSVTLQGTQTVLTPIISTSAIRLGTAVTMYPDDGEVTVIGTQKTVREVLSSGGALYYRAGSATYYSRSTALSYYGRTTLYYKDGNGAYHEARKDVGWYYTNSEGSYYLCSNGVTVSTISGTGVRLSTDNATMYESGGTVHKIGSGQTVFPSLSSGGTLYYQKSDQETVYLAGTTVSDRYYTKNS